VACSAVYARRMAEPNERPRDPLTLPGPWNAVASGYDEECYDLLPELTKRVIATLGVAPTATVLDVATGPGTLAIALAPQVERVIAVDFAEAMVERLRGHVSALGLTNVDSRVMDGEALELPDGSVDAAASMFGIFLFDNRLRALSELHRVVRPGGRAVVTSWLPPDQNTMLGASMNALREAIPELPKPAGPLPTQRLEVCAAELTAAGFWGVTAVPYELPVRFDSVDAYFRYFERAGAPIVLLKKKLGEIGFEAAKGRALASLRNRYGAGPLELRCGAILTSGTR
jgi:SAM-dependent methyltransferase